ncbi:hypothetical protein ACWZHB_19540 [Nocardia sp. FBN12]|uniref:hypothetical protein n=1 Tax=Nocardia sp. FBN12 TaxID=3419766 RepID=UPI003D02F2D4
MNTLTRTLITTFPLLCVAGIAGAPAAAHPVPADSGAPPTVTRPAESAPKCAGGGVVLAHPPARRTTDPLVTPQRAAAPGAVPKAPPPPLSQDGPDSTGDRPSGFTSAGQRVAISVQLSLGSTSEGARIGGLPAPSPVHSSGAGTAGSCGATPTVVPVVVVPRRELVPAPVPVQVTTHDLGAAPARPQGLDQSAGARSEIEIVVRAGGGSGSAAELPAVLRDMLRSLAAQQRVPTPRPHR